MGGERAEPVCVCPSIYVFVGVSHHEYTPLRLYKDLMFSSVLSSLSQHFCVLKIPFSLVLQILLFFLNKYTLSKLKHKSSEDVKCHLNVFIKTKSEGNAFVPGFKCSNE